jgi:hypothetical protein
LAKVQVILTAILILEDENLLEQLIELKVRIADIAKIHEFGINIYDLNDPKLEK